MKKSLLALLGIPALAGTITGLSFLNNQETDAERFLRNFPTQIDGARLIKKYDVEDAKYCLVHVLQSHVSDESSFEDYLFLDKNVVAVQRDIYSITCSLHDTISLDEVYVEGLTENLLPDISALKGRRFEVSELKGFSELSAEKKVLVSKYYSNLMDSQGALRAVLEGLVSARPGESSSIQDQLNLGSWGEVKPLIPHLVADYLGIAKRNEIISEDLRDKILYPWFEIREDFVIGSIASRNRPYGVVVYGALHAWGGNKSCGPSYPIGERVLLEDNIAKWNANNPDRKFSLIEVFPNSLR